MIEQAFPQIEYGAFGVVVAAFVYMLRRVITLLDERYSELRERVEAGQRKVARTIGRHTLTLLELQRLLMSHEWRVYSVVFENTITQEQLDLLREKYDENIRALNRLEELIRDGLETNNS